MTPVKMPEPDSYMFQHEETGLVDFVDRQQVEWGYEKNNPRWQRIGGAFTEEQMKAYAQAVRDEALKAVNVAAMTLAADMVLMYYDGNSKLDRDKVVERVGRWRTEWDKAMKEQSNGSS